MGGISTYSGSYYDWSYDEKVRKRSAASYAKADKRVYSGGRRGIKPPVGLDIKTESEFAEIIVLDVTGSMKDWPRLILEKLPTLYEESNAAMLGLSPKELAKKRKKVPHKLEISLNAIADTHGDPYPIQVSDFKKGKDLIKVANDIYIGGGGFHPRDEFTQESYELMAYYLLHHCHTPNIEKPICIIAGDEGFYEEVDPDDVKEYIGDDLQAPLNSREIMKELARRFDTYILRPEPTYSEEMYKKIHKQWESIFGPERVLRMEDPRRLVDCIIAISGYATKHWRQSLEMLKRRQTSKQVEEVLKTLHPLLNK